MTDKLNNLELALLDTSGVQLDFYLEETSTAQIMADIHDIRTKATMTTETGVLRMRIQEVLDRED